MNNHDFKNYKLAQERTLLACERTFSAWVRTALAAMAGGLAILRLISFKTDLHRMVAHGIGHMLIIWGCLIIILAAMDYKRTHAKLELTRNYKSSLTGYLIMVVPLLIISTLLILITTA